MTILVRGPVPRCAAITRHAVNGDRDAQLVKELVCRGLMETEIGKGACLGVYGDVVRPGRLRRASGCC